MATKSELLTRAVACINQGSSYPVYIYTEADSRTEIRLRDTDDKPITGKLGPDNLNMALLKYRFGYYDKYSQSYDVIEIIGTPIDRYATDGKNRYHLRDFVPIWCVHKFAYHDRDDYFASLIFKERLKIEFTPLPEPDKNEMYWISEEGGMVKACRSR